MADRKLRALPGGKGTADVRVIRPRRPRRHATSLSLDVTALPSEIAEGYAWLRDLVNGYEDAPLGARALIEALGVALDNEPPRRAV